MSTSGLRNVMGKGVRVSSGSMNLDVVKSAVGTTKVAGDPAVQKRSTGQHVIGATGVIALTAQSSQQRLR